MPDPVALVIEDEPQIRRFVRAALAPREARWRRSAPYRHRVPAALGAGREPGPRAHAPPVAARGVGALARGAEPLSASLHGPPAAEAGGRCGPAAAPADRDGRRLPAGALSPARHGVPTAAAPAAAAAA